MSVFFSTPYGDDEERANGEPSLPGVNCHASLSPFHGSGDDGFFPDDLTLDQAHFDVLEDDGYEEPSRPLLLDEKIIISKVFHGFMGFIE